MVQENQLMYQNDGTDQSAEEEYEQEMYGQEANQENGESEYDGEEANQNYSYQDPVQEVNTEDEDDGEEESIGEGNEHYDEAQQQANFDQPSDDDQDEDGHRVDGSSPLSERLAESGYFRASDPGRFEAVDDVNDIQLIARRESNLNQHNRSGKRKFS